MLDGMEDRDTSVIRMLNNITDSKAHSDGNPSKYKEATESVTSYEDLKSVQNTKKVLHKKSQLHPLFANHPYRCASMYCPRVGTSQPKLKDVSQRIVSAKILQVKELHNKLTLTQHQLNEAIIENKFLKTLQKRQEVALRKYEGHEARLPQLIQSHNEEVRILTSKFKQLKQTNQRLVEKLKGAEQQLSALQEEHLHLLSLSRNQQLGEREMLALKVQELQHTVREQNNTIQLLTRKVDLERKNYKHELTTEKGKRSEMQRKLALAMQTIENLKDQIEAKEKCMNAIVPSRYVRTSQSQTQQMAQSSRRTHSQFPRTPHVHTSFKNNMNEPLTTRRSSTDQTSNETDNPESQNDNNTSDSNRTINGMTLPMIKPQITNRNLRNQYKFPSKRTVNIEKSPNNIETGNYSSSLTSVENNSFKDLMKNSESESEKITQQKRQVVLNPQVINNRGRKFSVDSGVTNKSDENGTITQRTESTISSSKTRRNSISVCPSAENMEQFLQQDSLAHKMEAHKSIKDELKILEEKLLQGSQFLVKAKKQKSIGVMAEESEKGVNKSLSFSLGNTSPNDSDDEPPENFDSVNWNEIHNKIKAESDAAEAKLEEYYNSLEKSELNLEDTENYIALEEEQKEKLLKALKQIDKEAGGVSSSSSQDESKPSSNRKPARRKSEGHRLSISKNIDNLHRGRPVYDNVKIPAVEKMKKEEKEYLSDAENTKKSKAEFMKGLFGDFERVPEQKDSFSSERLNEDLDRLVLSRSFD